MFHLSDRVSRYDALAWDTGNLHQNQQNSPKVNIFFVISQENVYRPFFFAEEGRHYNWYVLSQHVDCLMHQLQEDNQIFNSAWFSRKCFYLWWQPKEVYWDDHGDLSDGRCLAIHPWSNSWSRKSCIFTAQFGVAPLWWKKMYLLSYCSPTCSITVYFSMLRYNGSLQLY